MEKIVDLISKEVSGAFEKAGFDAAFGGARIGDGLQIERLRDIVRGWLTNKHIIHIYYFIRINRIV